MDMNNAPRSSLSVAFSDQMRAEMAAARLTMPQLAARSGLSLSTIKRLAANQREMDTDQLDRLCKAFGISVLDFVMRADARHTPPIAPAGRVQEARSKRTAR